MLPVIVNKRNIVGFDHNLAHNSQFMTEDVTTSSEGS